MTARRGVYTWVAGLTLVLWVLAWFRPLALPDEGRYGDIGRYMLLSGDWLAPRLDGIPFFHKPPLLHWLQAAALKIAGVHPWVSRGVLVAHAALMLWAMAWATRKIWGEQVAQRAVLMLGTSLAFLIGGQYINHDMLVAAWIGVAIWCFALSLLQGDRPCPTLARWGFVACALGVLAKGLIGLVLPGLVLFVWITLTRQWRKILYLPWLSGLGLLACIALPWFIWVERVHPGVFDYLIVGQHFGRYTGTTFNNPWPWWFYGVILCGLLFPWTLLAYASGLARLIRQPWAWWRPASPEQALLWVWLIAIALFFSMPRSKLVGYILPVLPPLAVLAALAWQRWIAPRRWGDGVFAALCVANLAIATGANQVASHYTLSKRSSADVAQRLACEIQPGDEVWAAGAYPYDLPYIANLSKPVRVLNDWEHARRTAGDNWQREMFEGAPFDPDAAQHIMQPLDQLHAPHTEHDWLVTPVGRWQANELKSWQLVQQGRVWSLWRGSAGEGPESAQHKGLRCSNDHGQPQSRP
jgi:4-amino-4-deoxy-L-arabinose transferase-like glycosyltransferase